MNRRNVARVAGAAHEVVDLTAFALVFQVVAKAPLKRPEERPRGAGVVESGEQAVRKPARSHLLIWLVDRQERLHDSSVELRAGSTAKFRTSLEAECSRCLREIEVPIEFVERVRGDSKMSGSMAGEGAGGSFE